MKKNEQKKRGPKLRLNKEIIKVISEHIALSIPNKYACEMAGISERLFYKYLQMAERLFNEEGELIKPEIQLSKNEHILVHFVQCIKKGKAESVTRNVKIIQAAAITQWQAAARSLEWLDFEEFGRRDRIEATVHGHMTYEERIKQRRNERGIDAAAGKEQVLARSLNLAGKVDEVEEMGKIKDGAKSKSFLEKIKEDK